MEYSVSRGEIGINEIVLDTSSEQPIDIDFILPDYCPDIQKILKCCVNPNINIRNMSGDRLDVEGMIFIKLLYLDSSKTTVRFCEYSSPFSCSFNIKKQQQDLMNSLIFTDTTLEYINCRAISPRKIDIHGAFTVSAKVICKKNQEFITQITDKSVEQLKKTVKVSSVMGEIQKLFSINEILDIPKGKPEVETVVRSDVKAVVNDIKTIANKIIVKGEAFLKILYISDIENGEMETMEFSVPISQIIDIEGIEEDNMCDVSLDVMNYDIQVRADGAGDESIIETDIKMIATLIAYKESEIEIITDAYSKEYEIELDYKKLNFERMIDTFKTTYNYKMNFDIDDGVESIKDIWNESISVTAYKEKSNIIFKGKFNVCVLATNTEGEPIYREKMQDFEYVHDWPDLPEEIRCDTKAMISSLNFRITGSNGLEIKLDINLLASIYQLQNYRSICYAASDENKPRVKDNSASLIIYYADKGEHIWDIARLYCTCVDDIVKENDLSDKIIAERSMLLIPV